MVDFNNQNSVNQDIPASNIPPQFPSKPKSSKLLTTIIVISVLLFITLIFAGWSFVSYLSQKNNVDDRIASAVSDAKKEQADADAADFAEAEKKPNLEFIGPEDYGSLSFEYPKTWSVYVASSASDGGDYEAYLNPKTVPEVTKSQKFALRVVIEQSDYEDVVDDYDKLVEDGDLDSSTISVGDVKGTRLDGSFSDDLRGSAVIFKIRDKTLTIRTDANTFMSDFNALIKTIQFNQ